MMNKSVLKLCVILTLAMGFATHADASLQLTIGDVNYVGFIEGGQPANPTNEVGYINNLITLAAGVGPQDIGGRNYDRSNSTLAGPFDMAVVTDAVKQDNGNTSYDLPGTFQYILAKYDGPNWGDEVWYFPSGISGTVELPATAGGYGLSHTSAYNLVDGVIPEPGTLLIWGGLATVAVTVVRLRRASRSQL